MQETTTCLIALFLLSNSYFISLIFSGLETPIEELVEFIDAAKMAKDDDLQGEYLSSGTVECNLQV